MARNTFNVLRNRNLAVTVRFRVPTRQARALGLVSCVTIRAFGQAPADPTVYRVDPRSRLEVQVGKSGPLAGLGHMHRIRSDAFDGTIVYFPRDPARSRVEITVQADSLAVVPEADSGDIPEITRTMRTETLHVDSFPEITFVSHSVEPLGQDSLLIQGDFTLHGHTKPVSVRVALRATPDLLAATGVFTLRQTQFGIHPYRKALGLVRVTDQVTLVLAIIAHPPP